MPAKKTETKSATTYAAFLRGINVGGNNIIKMADVKKAFETLGYADVKTIGASGNVMFTGEELESAKMAARVEEGLRKKLSATSFVIVRSLDEVRKIIAADPFKGIKVVETTRLYVTFFNTPPVSKNNLAIPYQSTGNVFQILKVSGTEIYSVLDVSIGPKALDEMALLEKEFGKTGTTRNWNTVVKVAGKG